MFIFFVLPILAGCFTGLTEIFNKSITEEKYSSISYSFLQWFGNLVIYSLPFIYLREKLPTDYHAYIPLIIVVIIVFIGNILLIKSYKTEDASNVNIISRISLIISFLNGIFLLSESVNLYKILGVFLIFAGILVIFYQGKRLKFSHGFVFAFLSGICFGMMAYLNKLALPYFSSVTYLFTANLMSVTMFLLIPNALKDVKPILTKYCRNYLFSRIFSASGYFLLIFALSRAEISVVNTNFETAFLLSTVTIGILFLHEKRNVLKKLAGTFLCALGIILLNFF